MLPEGREASTETMAAPVAVNESWRRRDGSGPYRSDTALANFYVSQISDLPSVSFVQRSRRPTPLEFSEAGKDRTPVIGRQPGFGIG
jgi:hypothetical protein